MGIDVLSGLVTIHVADAALDVDALADGGIGLELEFFPEFSLPGQEIEECGFTRAVHTQRRPLCRCRSSKGIRPVEVPSQKTFTDFFCGQ